MVSRQMDRLTTMRLLFPKWSADNLRARAAYYEHLNELEAPRLCQKKLHVREGEGGCPACRNERERRLRREGVHRPYVGRLTKEQMDEVVRRYVEELESPLPIGQSLGVAMGTINRVLVDRRVHIRDNREAHEALLERRRRADETERSQESA